MADALAAQRSATSLAALKFSRTELAGGLGDLGLLLPISVALVTVNGLNATAVFASAGLAYIGTALYFRVPLPVQPLKAFAAAAIALKVDANTIAAGAALMAVVLAVISVTRSAGWLTARFPLVLVRGIQASVALLLVKAAWEMAQKGNWKGLPPIDPTLSVGLALTVFAVLVLLRDNRFLPGTVIVLASGFGIGLAVSGWPQGVELGPQALQLASPNMSDFSLALTALVIAQLPLTFGNSIVATTDAERTYFGEQARRVQPNRLAGSMAIWNSISALFYGLPICHGAGGATAHYKLGARTGGATLILGSALLVLAIVFGASLPLIFYLVVPGALAGMLLYVAFQHGLLAASLKGWGDRAIIVLVAIATLALGSLAWGFAAGLLVVLLRELWRRVGASKTDRRPLASNG